ncbi:hypothetical protein TRAPUB_2833 [Trametes pubescens]|uniref:Uncharacterized protein n=1 Tax=Trametes pubescens TaxID=154538 RepID=A0A1M2VFE8_TRAPU|nr:hypothetical protein TRAPUB_2833 [Trametes pubescens]
MKYAPHGYATSIVIGRGLKLVGWPNGPEDAIPFGDPSDIPGGQPVIGRLLALWKSGELHFEPASEEERMLARRDPKAVLPGKPLERPAPRCWGPCGRNDMKKARKPRPVVNANGRVIHQRRKRLGPITPKIVLGESDLDENDEVRSSGEESAWEDAGVVD